MLKVNEKEKEKERERIKLELCGEKDDKIIKQISIEI